MAKLGVMLRFRINQLARLFYKLHGYNVEEGYDFSKAVHPQEKLMWEMAELAFEYWSK